MSTFESSLVPFVTRGRRDTAQPYIPDPPKWFRSTDLHPILAKPDLNPSLYNAPGRR